MTLKDDPKLNGKLTLGLGNDIKEFGELLLSKAYKVLDENVQKNCHTTVKSDAKFEEKLTLRSKNDMRSLMNFIASSAKSENFHFDVLLLSKVYYV